MRRKIKRKKDQDFRGKILKVLTKSPNKAFNYKQLAARLEVTDTNGRNEIIKELNILHSKNKIDEIEKGKYQIIPQIDYYEGYIDMTSRKTAYFKTLYSYVIAAT